MLTRRSWLRRLWVQLAHTLPKASARKGLRARKASQTQAEVLELRTLLTAPAVTSIELNGPTVTNSSSLSWTVVFDQAVSGVDATESFADTVGLVSAAQIQVAGGGTAYQVPDRDRPGSSASGKCSRRLERAISVTQQDTDGICFHIH